MHAYLELLKSRLDARLPEVVTVSVNDMVYNEGSSSRTVVTLRWSERFNLEQYEALISAEVSDVLSCRPDLISYASSDVLIDEHPNNYTIELNYPL